MNLFGKLAEAVVVGVAGHFIAKPVIEGIENAIEQNRRKKERCVYVSVSKISEDEIPDFYRRKMRLSELSDELEDELEE